VDSASLATFTREHAVQARLVIGDSIVASTGAPYADAAEDTVDLTYAVQRASGNRLAAAHLVFSHSFAELHAVTRDINQWFAAAIALVALASLALASWLSSRFSRPLAELAQATSRIELSGGDGALPTDRADEIGTLARRLKALTARLRGSAVKLRDAERRATVGELARQVNHDIKNGLIPIRNVLRHLSGVAEQEPTALPAAFGERRATLQSSVEYLDTLARNYAKLTPRAERAPIDVNAVVAEAVRSASASDDADVRAELAPRLPLVAGDAVALRRIVDNLVTNAVESADGRAGAVRIRTEAAGDGVAIVVSDTGRGMSVEELSRAFDDFYTTKPDGTGLGLSVVRRLASDMGGEVRAQSEPGRGTTITVTVPAAS
jgi:signal transduction histidine kinase